MQFSGNIALMLPCILVYLSIPKKAWATLSMKVFVSPGSSEPGDIFGRGDQYPAPFCVTSPKVQSTFVYADRATSHCTPRYSGNTHRCQWSPDPGFRSRYQAMDTRDRKPLSNLSSCNHNDTENQSGTCFFQLVHFVSPMVKLAGRSPVPLRSFRSTRSALLGFLNSKPSVATSAPVVHALV